LSRHYSRRASSAFRKTQEILAELHVVAGNELQSVPRALVVFAEVPGATRPGRHREGAKSHMQHLRKVQLSLVCNVKPPRPLSIARWVPGPYVVLGTDGYGLCESRSDLRAHFEVSAESIAWAALASLADVGAVSQEELAAAAERLAIEPGKPDAAVSGPAECLETRMS